MIRVNNNKKHKVLILVISLLFTLYGIYNFFRIPTLNDFEWYKVRESSKSVEFTRVKDSHTHCSQLGVKHSLFQKIKGCAKYSPDVCTIYTEYEEKEIPEYLKEHELKHCDGWSHNKP